MLIKLKVLRELVAEATRASKLGIKLDKPVDVLKKYVSDNTFITFSTLNKVGINPRSTYYTPLGIYTYPLDEGFIEAFTTGVIDFAADRPFMHVMRPSDNANIVYLQRVTSERALELINLTQVEIRDKQFDSIKAAAQAVDKVYSAYKDGDYNYPTSPGALLWFWTYHVTRKPPYQGAFGWNKLFRKIGVDGVVDMGDGIIHPDQPAQAVFFTKVAVTQLATINNPRSQSANSDAKIVTFYSIPKPLQTSFLNRLEKNRTLADYEFRIGLLVPNGFLEKAGRYYQAYDKKSKRLRYAEKNGNWVFYD